MTSATEGRRPRLLYICFYFPPTRASGVHRGLSTANHFAAAGWDVTVITPQREFFRDYIHSYDASLDSWVDRRITVERVPYKGWHFEPDIRQFGVLRGNLPRLAMSLHQQYEKLIFPETYSPWIVPTLRRAVRLHRREPFDMVLATGNPHASFAVAWGLHRLTGVDYAIDYRDSWTLNLYTDEPAYPAGHPAWRWERRVLGKAARIIFVNEPLREWHQRRYPDLADRMTVVLNGWEPDQLGELLTLRPHHDRPLQLGYLGTLTQAVPLTEFVDGWRLARKETPLENAEVRLFGHLGYFRANAADVRARIPLDEGINISYEGPVAKSDVGATYDHLDILLLMLAGSRYVTSGKVFEYMATGKPIVSVHPPDIAASDVLRGYPMWFPTKDLEPDNICAALIDAAKAAGNATQADVDACRAFASRYTRAAQIAPLEHAFREIIGG
jgi:glycosyltransferase involved in cell wall biosynthesis